MTLARHWLFLAVCLGGCLLPGRLLAADSQELTCRQFLGEALGQDPEFNRALHTYLQAKYAVLSTRAMSDLTLGAAAGWVHTESTSGVVFEPQTIDTLSYQVSLQKLFLESGTRLKLAHENGLTDLGYNVDPALAAAFGGAFDLAAETSQPVFRVSLVQPLLKNAFGLAERFPVVSAELQRQAAELDAREAWEKRLAELYGAYFDWVAAYENVAALREIVSELKRLEEQVGRKVRSGVAERTDLLRTRDNVLNFQGQLSQAEGALLNATRDIACLRAGRPETDPGKLAIRPDLAAAAPDCVLLEDGTAEAEVNRLRLLRKLELALRQVEEREFVANNSSLPQMDLVGDVAWKGRSDDKQGGYDQVNRRDYSVFLQASYPLGGMQAGGDEGQARSGREELHAGLAATRQTLALALVQMAENIRRFRDVEQLQQEQVRNAEEKLALDERNYRIGRLDTFYLIDAQNALTSARLNLVRTQIQLKRLQLEYLSLSDRLLSGFPELEARLSRSQGE
ncbi:MAG: TolC family protein [candidate division FCPU426 bacterium]